MIQSTPFRFVVAMLAVASMLVGVSGPVEAADLSADQAEALNAVISELNKATDNYNLAAQSAGGGTDRPTGSKAKLAQIRLDSAKKPLPAIAAALDKLPADNANVKQIRAQYDQVAAACQALQDRLDGKSAAPAPKDGDAPAPAPAPDKPAAPGNPAAPAGGEMKLDYKQEDLLKNARFHLNELEGFNKTLTAWADKAEAVEDKSTIQWADAQGIGELIAKAKTRVQYSGDTLAKLPGNGAGVAEQAARREQLTAALVAQMKRIEPTYTYLAKLVNPASYPTLNDDVKRMRDLSSMYNNTQVLDHDADQAAAVIGQAPQAWAAFQEYAKTYGPLSNQTTELAKQVKGAGLGFANNYKEFAAAVGQKKEQLPGEIDGHLTEALEAADTAVAEKKPLWFTGGVQQKMDWARDKTKMLAAIDEAAGKKYSAKLAAAEADIRKKQESLRADIIAANRLPNDAYNHPDRKALEAKAIEAWKKREPNAQVLMVRMPVENWKRKRTLWLRDRTITETDASHLQVQLIVKLDGQHAVSRPINLTKDHTMNDQLFASPFDSEDEKVTDLPPHRFYLLKNVK